MRESRNPIQDRVVFGDRLGRASLGAQAFTVGGDCLDDCRDFGPGLKPAGNDVALEEDRLTASLLRVGRFERYTTLPRGEASRTKPQ